MQPFFQTRPFLTAVSCDDTYVPSNSFDSSLFYRKLDIPDLLDSCRACREHAPSNCIDLQIFGSNKDNTLGLLCPLCITSHL